jgi:5-methyltetrahydrofolate--homocysteine methyltransferase
MKIEDEIKKRILVLDGAMGTMIQSYQLSEQDFRGDLFDDLDFQMKGNNDILSLTRPDVIEDIHRRYLEAGADIITTNTFSAQRISMADYHCEDLCDKMNRAAARIALSIAKQYTEKNPAKPRFVVASIGPTNKTASMSPDVNDPALRDVTFDQLAEAYHDQMKVLVEEGVDGLLIETIFDTLNAKAAIYAAEEVMEAAGRKIPIMLSATVSDKAGRTLSGQRLDSFVASISHANIFSVGLNCSFGPQEIRPFLEELARKAPYYISVHPNAGLPNAMGTYDVTPEQMAEQMKIFVDERLVNIIGGCCGTTDEFIAQYKSIVAEENGNAIPIHIPADASQYLQLSGLELLEETPEIKFINVGERCNVAGSRKFLRLISSHAYDEALEIARKQVDDGAQVLDLNMDDGLLDTQKEMTTFVNLLASDPDISRVPLMIDSSKFNVIEESLKCIQGKPIVNSISLKEGEEIFIERAKRVHRLGAAMIVMAFDENGQACTYEQKVSVCKRAYDLLTTKAGIPPTDIIFDPNVLSIATGMPEHDRYALDFIEATAWIRENLPGAHVSGGVSNLSFAFRGNNYLREAMHAVFLYHAINAGMDMGIVNPATRIMYSDIPDDLRALLEDVILYKDAKASERLIELAPKLLEEKQGAASKTDGKEKPDKELSIEELLKQDLIKGDTTHLDEHLACALQKYEKAVEIIEGPLMAGMATVGKHFATGRMFLPQVVKTARTMKKAVEFLQPYIEKEKSSQSNAAGTVLLATVKGDVHDIGKNIVSVVMACNNYNIIDLGVMCPAADIVNAAKEHHVDIIGLSGLITPSLDEMCNVASKLKEAGIHVPLMIGGATTSALHTALKIAPLYDGSVVWVKDAAQNSIVASRLLNPDTYTDYVENLRKEQKLLCENNRSRTTFSSLGEARANKVPFNES